MLVRPFIEPISAFDVANGTGTATIGILGGDVVENINYEIYSSSMLIYSSSIQVTDMVNPSTGLPIEGIRNFDIALSQGMGLMNNNSYTIRVYTQNTTLSEISGYSSVQYFSCYITPVITLKDSSANTIGSNYEFTDGSGEISVVFDKVSTASDAILNDIEINIFGINGSSRDLVYSSGTTYTPFVIEYANLTPTTGANSIYASYTLEWTAHTVQNMFLSGELTSMTCDYTITQDSGIISVENDSANGRIKVIFNREGSFGDLLETPFGTSGIWAMVESSGKIYMGGESGKFTIYNKSTGTFSPLITTPSTYDIVSLATDGQNVYAGGTSGEFAIYNISTGTFGSLITTPFSGTIDALATDGQIVYAGGANGQFSIYNISTGTFGSLVTTPFGTSYINSIAISSDKVYVSGNDGKFAIYDITTGTFGSLVANPFDGLSIYTIVTDGQNVYAGGAVETFAVYNISSQSFGDLIPNPFNGATIQKMALEERNLYVGGVNGKFAVYSTSSGKFSSLIETPFNSTYLNSIVAANHNVYVCGDNGEFAIFTLNDVEISKRNINADNGFCTLLSLGENDNVQYGINFFYDYYTKTDTIYEYKITSGTQVETVQVLSQFCGAYIADGTSAYEISEDWQVPDYNRNQKSVIYEPYGRKYPVVAYNALTNYESGSDMAILRSENNRSNKTNNYLDRISQTKILKQFNNFLTNRKTKVRKDFNGNIALVVVLNPIPNSFMQELGNGIAKTQFSWVEVGEFTDSDFKNLGITNSFAIYGY